MSKYIDAEKLKAEIERLKKHSQEAKMEFVEEGYSQNAFAEGCRLKSFDKLLSFIDSLQQDQPECIYGRTLEEREKYCKFCSAACKVSVEQDHSEVDLEVDLEKELEKWRHDHFKGKRDGDYSGEYLERESQLDLTHHFYGLGLNARKEESK